MVTATAKPWKVATRARGARRKVLVGLLVALGFYALSDILLWQRIFEAHQLSMFDSQYQTGHVAILVGIMGTAGVLLLDAGFWALWFEGALYTMAFGGVEDVLYFWLDGRSIPHVLPWLDRSRLIFIRPGAGDVTSAELLASAAFWLALWLALLVLVPLVARRRHPRGNLGARVKAQLVQDAADVRGHGALGDEQPSPDLLVAQSLGDEPGD